MRNITKRQ